MLQQSIPIARRLAIGLTLKIRCAGGQCSGGTTVVMFFFVSCVFFGVQWRLVVESLPLVRSIQIKTLYTQGLVSKIASDFFFRILTPAYIGLSFEKKTASSTLFMGRNLIKKEEHVQNY